jgi:predicted phosphodiesterase
MENFWDKSWLVLSDMHIPFHDKNLLVPILELIEDGSFNGIVLLGDIHDFFRLSKHNKDDRRAYDLQSELEESQIVLRQIRGALGKQGKIVYVLGNHEKRLRKYLCGDATALSTLQCLEFNTLVGIDKYNIRVEKEIKICPTFLLRHGTKCGKYPARAELGNSLMSGMSGHSHKTDKAIMHGTEKVIEWFSLGHLANRPVLSNACLEFDEDMNWDQSFGIVRTKDINYNVEIIRPDHNGFYCEYTGKYYLRG